MKLSQNKIVLALLVLAAASASGCGFVNRIRAKNALNEGVRAYKDGRFQDAQQRSEEILNTLHPIEEGEQPDTTQKNALTLRAYSIQQQYKPGVETDENKKLAEDAVSAYQQIMKHNPDDEVAYNQIAVIYRQLKEEGKERDWLMQRANLESAPKEKRAEALVVLASKQWKCSYDITESNKSVNKQTAVVSFKKPDDPSQIGQAQTCVAEGMRLAEQAINFNPNSPDAWTYKTNLLREKARLAQMDGKADEQKRFDEEANKAEEIQRRLTEEAAARKAEAEAKKSPTPPAS